MRIVLDMRKLIFIASLTACMEFPDPKANPDLCCKYALEGEPEVRACLQIWLDMNPNQCWQLSCPRMDDIKMCGPDYEGPLDDDL